MFTRSARQIDFVRALICSKPFKRKIMKKQTIVFILALVSITLGITIASCNKTSQTEPKAVLTPKSVSKKGVIYFSNGNAQARTFIYDSAEISPDGYLIFPNVKVLESYRLYIVGKTHSQVQSYLSTQGFSSYGTTIYQRSYLTQQVTNDQAADYLLNTDLIVQIGDILYRPKPSSSCTTVKWEFLLAMDKSKLNVTSLGLLKNGTYDASSMNQFATNPATDASYTIDEYMRNTAQSGYQESTPNACPGGAAMRPMFGHGPWINTTCTVDNPNNWTDHNGDGVADPTYTQCRKRRTYVMWIGVGWDTECYVAYSCGSN